MSGPGMAGNVREWLPIEAATGPRVRDALAAAVDGWSSKWFAAGRANVAGIEPRPAGAPRLADGWRLHGAVAVPADGSEAIRLAGLALAADPESLVLSEPDRDILGRLAAAIAADLAAMLGEALGLGAVDTGTSEDPFAGGGGILVRIADAQGRRLIQAAVPLAALVPFLKAGIGSGRPGAPLAGLARAIETVPVAIDVRLGETGLGLGDLAALATGDVLILDRPIDDGARLALAPNGRPFARAGLVPQGNTTSLVLDHEPRDRPWPA